MSYAMRGFDGFDGLGVDVSVTDPLTGSVLVQHPTAEAPECGSALAMQQMLADLGYYKAAVDGLFTIETFAALQHFFLDVGVPYRPGTYPGAPHCAALLAAWQNKQARTGPVPSPGHPAVLPGITPADRIAGVRAAAAQAASCPPTPPVAVSGFWGFGRALGALAFGASFDPTAQVTIRLGSSGAPVALWQTIIGVTPADGKFGPNTQKATIAWQKANGLTGDGVVGQMSWAKAAQVVTSQIPGAPPVVPPLVPGGAPPILIPPPPGGGGGTTTTPSGTSPPPADPGAPPVPAKNPVERAQEWWASQPKPTQYAVMGGAAVVVLGLLALVAGGGDKKKKPAVAQPNRRRYRQNARKRRPAKRRGRAACRGKAPKRYRLKGATARSDYAYPECWKYPVRFRKGGKVRRKLTVSHVRAAAARFGKHARRYPKTVRRRIAARIAQAERKYAIGPYRSR